MEKFLITPIQRSPRYKLFLEEIIKNLDSNNKNSNRICSSALKSIEQSTSEINSSL